MPQKKTSTTHHGKPSQARKQFASLLSKLQAAHVQLDAWHAAEREVTELSRTELLSAKQEHDKRLKQLMVLLDQKHGDPALDDWEQAQLADFIDATTTDLLEEADDAELEAILQRHRGDDDDNDDDDDDDDEDLVYQEGSRIS